MNKEISKQLNNCFEAYSFYPFESRYNSFKDKKKFFLEYYSEEEKYRIYHEFIFFHFCYYHLVYPNLIGKNEILKYFYTRKNEGRK
jgi:hypothetical protein